MAQMQWSTDLMEDKEHLFHGTGEGGEKTNDQLPLESTTIGQEMKEDTDEAFPTLHHQHVYRAHEPEWAAADMGPLSGERYVGSMTAEGGGRTKDQLPPDSTTVGQQMKDDNNKAFPNVKSQHVAHESRSFEGGEKTKDELPLGTTTVGQEMKEEAHEKIIDVHSQPVYRAHEPESFTCKEEGRVGHGFGISSASADESKESGSGAGGRKDADIKGRDSSGSRRDQPGFPEELGAADDEFVTRNPYNYKDPEKEESDTRDSSSQLGPGAAAAAGTLAALIEKISGPGISE